MQGQEEVNLRGKRAVVFHPDDSDSNELLRHLSRIGLDVEHLWDNTTSGIRKADFIFAPLSRQTAYDVVVSAPFITESTVCVLIIESESPTVLREIVLWDAIITKPFRPFGLLAQLVYASRRKQMLKDREKRTRVLKRKLDGFRQVESAKEFLMENYGLSGRTAFSVLRQDAMSKRKTIEEAAREVNKASGILESIDVIEMGKNVSLLCRKKS